MAIERIGVVGAGVMGSEIAFSAAAAGIEVALRDVDRSLIERGLAHVGAIAERRVARGRMTEPTRPPPWWRAWRRPRTSPTSPGATW